MRYASAVFLVALAVATFAHAAKLAPTQNSLQPFPANVHPAVSENVQRTASPADVQAIENVQAAEENSAFTNEESGSVPSVPFVPSPSSDSLALVIALVVAALVAGGAAWLWKSF